MFSWSEIILIALLILFLFGPKELTKLTEQVGTVIKKWRRFNEKIKTEIEQQIKYQQLAENEARAAKVDALQKK